jgi:hypothetical protein
VTVRPYDYEPGREPLGLSKKLLECWALDHEGTCANARAFRALAPFFELSVLLPQFIRYCIANRVWADVIADEVRLRRTDMKQHQLFIQVPRQFHRVLCNPRRDRGQI